MYFVAEIESTFCLHHCSDTGDGDDCTWEDEDEDERNQCVFRAYESLGCGSFGVVYRGLYPNGYNVAIKKYPAPSQDEHDLWAELARFEMRILSTCRHKNIVRCIISFFQDGSLYTITEFVFDGSLTTLVNFLKRFPENVIRRHAVDILRGL
ncbi:putative protein kinase [Trypanosoma rangeli]|uniref:Protein kinase domain-containing protein n=1 Tax=Trypanosoma rangeli TaxID=5698 RepID=A0A3R7K9S8_TRYRA|nr:putative protein kinase [Trypanosoma rangeli]RNF02272.1 putative protein kinase [Trypanosoma rangeli]|eukprot:RNF02272.1 putative protein kinase [Trypanosoma rangeli]